MINLSNQRINHLKSDMLSEGIVTKQDDSKCLFWVSFKIGNDEKTLKFRYPDAFKMGFIETVNEEIQQEINKEINLAGCSAEKTESNLTIEGILANRQISELVHFTKLENLTSIIKYGLFSVDQLAEQGIKYHFNDDKRLDGRTDCICTSVHFPNPANLKIFRDKYPGCSWVIIVLDAQLILNHVCFFAEHNAATSRIKNNIERRKSPEAFEGMFAETVQGKINTDGTIDVYSRKQMHNDISCLPTSYQAEILVKDHIEQKYIKGAFFMNEKDMKQYQDILAAKEIDVGVFPELFTLYRNDFNFEV